MGHISPLYKKLLTCLERKYVCLRFRAISIFTSFTSWCLGRNRVQRYEKFCTYANLFVLLLGIHRNIRATLVKLVDMDVVLGHIGDDDGCFGELVDVVESVEVLA